MRTDEQLLAGIPDHLSIAMMLKATPAQEGGKRYVYLEASREARDQQNELVLAKALENSADHFMKFGNLDLDHKSMPAVAKMHGIERPELFEIGAPVDVRFDGVSTFVKAELFSGDTPLAANANMVWDSMTRLSPAKKWYPSVGGKILAKSVQLDRATGDKIGVVSDVRWTNVALSAHPVNQHVGGITTVPFGMLAKCWDAQGLNFAKALEASYATDAAGKTGGAAFGAQSLDTGTAPHSYFDFRDKLSAAINKGSVKSKTANGLVEFSTGNFSLSNDEAAEWVDRFLSDLKSGLSNLKRGKS